MSALEVAYKYDGKELRFRIEKIRDSMKENFLKKRKGTT